MNDNSIIYFRPPHINTFHDSKEYHFSKNVPYFYAENKSENELKWEVFSSIYEVLRNPIYYDNIQEVEGYFEEKYNMCFFRYNYICKIQGFNHLYNENGMNFDDFKKIILPNIKISFFQEINSKPPTFEDKYLVVFNWEFFKDINDYSSPNVSYSQTGYENYPTGMSLNFSSYSDVICYVNSYLFELPFFRPDAFMKGLNFSSYINKNSTIDKYFEYQKDAVGKGGYYLLPRNRGWECDENSQDIQSDFEAILKYFEEKNMTLCRIFTKNHAPSDLEIRK